MKFKSFKYIVTLSCINTVIFILRAGTRQIAVTSLTPSYSRHHQLTPKLHTMLHLSPLLTPASADTPDRLKLTSDWSVD